MVLQMYWKLRDNDLQYADNGNPWWTELLGHGFIQQYYGRDLWLERQLEVSNVSIILMRYWKMREWGLFDDEEKDMRNEKMLPRKGRQHLREPVINKRMPHKRLWFTLHNIYTCHKYSFLSRGCNSSWYQHNLECVDGINQ